MNTTTAPPSLPTQVAAIKNLLAFSRKSGIPYRTLVRIKVSGAAYPMATTTRIALEAALKKHKPKSAT